MSNEPESNNTEKPRTKTKKINGLLILGLILLVTFVVSYRPDVPNVYCDEEVLATKPDVIMFGTWWCPYCYQARQYFHNNDIHYCEYDIEKSDIGKTRYDETQASAIPALIIGKYLLQGFDENSIEKALTLTKNDNEPSD